MKTSSSGKKAVIPFDDKLLVDATHTDKTEMEPATKLQWIERLLKKYPLKSKEKVQAYRITCTFVICQVIGTLVYVICALKYSTSPRIMGTLLSAVVQLFNCGMIGWRTFRIIVFLAIPSLVTSRLRALLLILIFVWSIQIPGGNIMSNIQSTAEGIVCVQEQVKLLSEELQDSVDKNLRQVPIRKIQRYLQKSMQPFIQIRETLRNLDESLSKMMSWQRALILKIRKILDDCSVHALAPYHACVGSLTHLHEECLEATYDVICSPIILLKKICHISKILELQCEWPKMLKGQLEEGVDYFVKESKQNAIEYFQKTVFYDVYTMGKGAKKSYDTLEIALNHSFSVEQKVDVKLNEFRDDLRKEVRFIEVILDAILLLSNVMFAVVLILPFIFAFTYMRSYRKKLGSNNYFITEELENLNRRQQSKQLPSIFPLSYEEQKLYIHYTDLRIVPSEYTDVLLALVLTTLSVAIPAVFVVLDFFIYQLLYRGYDFFHSDATRLPKPNVYRMNVTGEGFLSELLSNILNAFEPLNAESEARDSMWHDCFEEPNPPNYHLYLMMLIMFIVCVFLCIVQVYAKRFRHKIAGYYFPERRPLRAIFLFNKILEARYALEHGDSDTENDSRSKTDGRASRTSSSMSF